jgi:DAACS family dicarboxylate/amino acid:cation (Na+ or H+) symporter
MRSSASRILLGMLLGGLLGGFVAPHAPWVSDVVGRLVGAGFVKLLLLWVLPLAASALVLGVAELRVGALSGTLRRLAAWTLILTGCAVAIGIAAVRVFAPGAGVDRAALPAGDAVRPPSVGVVDTLLGLVPDNLVAAAARGELLGVLLAAVLLGLALRSRAEDPDVAVLRSAVAGLYQLCVRVLEGVMRLAPVGVAGLACTLVARAGLSGLVPLARFVAVTVSALAVQALVVYPLVLVFAARRDPRAFFAAVRPAMTMAFATSSSAATLPTALEVAERGLGLPSERARFVLTVGATGNQNGTALFEGVAVLFLAQLYGVELDAARQAAVVLFAVLAGVGTAGVPGGSLPVIAAMCAGVGVPPEGVGVLVGVDRFLDMCRTTLNVTGDLVVAAVVTADDPPSA